jgi:hypothetical protein
MSLVKAGADVSPRPDRAGARADGEAEKPGRHFSSAKFAQFIVANIGIII